MRSAIWHHAVGSPGTVTVLGDWSIGPVLHFSNTVAACLYVLQALNALPDRMTCRNMMALMSGAMETCAHALGTYEPYCTGRPTKLFFMFEARDPQGTVARVVARSSPSKEARSGATGHAAHRSPPNGSRATVHVAAS
jgi:hypothetical protein